MCLRKTKISFTRSIMNPHFSKLKKLLIVQLTIAYMVMIVMATFYRGRDLSRFLICATETSQTQASTSLTGKCTGSSKSNTCQKATVSNTIKIAIRKKNVSQSNAILGFYNFYEHAESRFSDVSSSGYSYTPYPLRIKDRLSWIDRYNI